MYKNSENTFFNHIIDYNFLFLDKKFDKKKYNRSIKEGITFLSKTKTEHVQILEIEQLIKGLKQLTRTLQFLKKSRNNELFVDTDNNYTTKIINIFINNNKKILNKIKVKNVYEKNLNKNFLIAILKLNNYSSKKIYNNFLEKNYFIIHELSDTYHYNNYGIYKIFNNLEDWKKLVFFLMFIKKNYSKKKKYEIKPL